jgi:hypothetical protein
MPHWVKPQQDSQQKPDHGDHGHPRIAGPGEIGALEAMLPSPHRQNPICLTTASAMGPTRKTAVTRISSFALEMVKAYAMNGSNKEADDISHS